MTTLGGGRRVKRKPRVVGPTSATASGFERVHRRLTVLRPCSAPVSHDPSVASASTQAGRGCLRRVLRKRQAQRTAGPRILANSRECIGPLCLTVCDSRPGMHRPAFTCQQACLLPDRALMRIRFGNRRCSSHYGCTRCLQHPAFEFEEIKIQLVEQHPCP